MSSDEQFDGAYLRDVGGDGPVDDAFGTFAALHGPSTVTVAVARAAIVVCRR